MLLLINDYLSYAFNFKKVSDCKGNLFSITTKKKIPKLHRLFPILTIIDED